MADSKITQLPLSPYALDKDLIVAVTGHLEDGAYPYNTRMPLSYIRRYVVRLNLMTSPESGISTYYHSGLNVLTLQHTPVTGNLMRYDYADEYPHNQTISTTGLNIIRGNNLDIQFDDNSLAALRMDAFGGPWESSFERDKHLGEPYHSGIISVTGLNAFSGHPFGNLMRVDYGDDWPFSGIISQTGLNSIQGNLVDVKFDATSEAAVWMHNRDGSWQAFNKNTHLGNKYHSGIISITGLNAYSGAPYGNLMRVDFDVDKWPYSGVLSTTGLNSIVGNNMDVVFHNHSEASVWMSGRDGAWQAFDPTDNLGNKYHSGIISTTGLNAYSGAPYGNLMRVDFDVDQWPYSGVISQTGLNSIAGNLVDVKFNATSEAAKWMHGRDGSWHSGFHKSNNLGNKYHSGIISITGLNAYSGAPYGNLMRVDFDVDQWPYSGVLSTTGLNSIVGNNMDVVFHNHSEASVWMSGRDGAWQAFDPTDNLGNKYHSGIISTTGLNAYSGAPYGNLMRVDFDVDQWPYSGVISQTGLNSIAGNLVDVKFNATSEAAVWMHNRNGSWQPFNKNNNLGNKYHSGIISITGLNAYSGHPYGNNIRVDFDVDKWPYSGVISQTGLNAVRGNLLDIQFASTSDAAEGMHDRNGPWYNAFNKNNNLGNKYYSGILSITGVNAVTENLIVKEYQNQWPFTGIYYNTGLNARAGNHIEIMHAIDSEADFAYPNILGGRYLSGVISVTGLNVLPQTTGNLIDNHISQAWPHKNIFHTTGLNAYSGDPYGNNIRVDYGTIWPYSGIISQTGLNAIRGNLIDIVFDKDSDAAITMNNTTGPWNNSFNRFSHLGNKYHSGIISVTGLNIGDDGNRINYTIESDWPYKYNIDATGLNIVKGNEFSNALNGIAYNIEPDNNRQYDLFSLSKIKHYSSTQIITVDNSYRTTKSVLDAGAFISYCNIKRHKPSDSLKVLAEASLRLEDNCVTLVVPEIADLNSTNSQKETEIGASALSEMTIGGLTDAANTDYDKWDPWRLEIDNSSFPLKLAVSISGNNVSLIDDDPIEFTTNIDTIYRSDAGQSSKVQGTTNLTVGTDELIYEKHRTSTALGLSVVTGTSINFGDGVAIGDPINGTFHLGSEQGITSLTNPTASGITLSLDPASNPYTLGASQAMTLKAIVTPSISSSTYNINGCIGIKYSLTNTKYKRQYRKHLGTATANDTDQIGTPIYIGDQVYRYFTSSTYNVETRWTINNTRYLKCEPIEQAPTITFTTQPTNQTSEAGAATFTAVAKVNDYTDPLYQWQEAPAGTTNFTDMSGKNNNTLSLTNMQHPADNGKRYRVRVTAYDGLTTSTSNYATLTTSPPTITVITHPTDQIIATNGTASFYSNATANVGGTTIDKQWQVSTDNGVSWSSSALVIVNGTNSTSNTLNLAGLTSSDHGNLYRCKFSSSGFSTVYSNSAELFFVSTGSGGGGLELAVAINGHPTSQTISRGIAAWTASATLTGSSSFELYYIWEKSTNGGTSYSQVRADVDLTSISNDPSVSYSNGKYSPSPSSSDDTGGLTYDTYDQSLWRVKVRINGFGDDIEVISNSATLTVQEIDITSQPDGNKIYGKTMITRGYSRNYIPTNNGAVTLSMTAVARNSSATLYYQWQESSDGYTWTDIAGKTSSTLNLTSLTQNTTENEYKCLVDDEALSGSDSTGMVKQTSSKARITTSTFISASNTNIDDNTSFATVDRDSTGTVSETMFITFCYDLTDEIGHGVSLDAQADGTATIEFGQPTALTSVASFSATHPNQVTDNKTIGASNSTVYYAGDVINLKVTGQVSQYLARLNIPLP